MRARVRARNRRALAKWRQTRAEGLALPAKPDEFPDEWPHPDDWPSSDPEGERAYYAARGEIELRMRTALAKGELRPDYHDREGRIRRCIDRRAWAESLSPPGLGLQDQIHPASCPGPPELEGCFVSLDAIELEAWLRKELRLRQAAERRARSASARAKAAKAEARVKAEIKRRGGFMPLNEGAQFILAIAPDYGRDRARKFIGSLTGSDRPGPRRPRSPAKT
jgi:hypothetical protein